jgi:hypothetical protein
MGIRREMALKPEVDVFDFLQMHPSLYAIISFVLGYCQTHQLPCLITSLMDEAEGRVSRTHQEGRAFDVSTRGWSEFHIHRLVKMTNDKFKDIGAVSNVDLVPRAAIYHKVDGGDYHFHFQVRPELPGIF